MSRTITIVDDDQGYSVTAQVTRAGCTHFAVTSLDEGRPLPAAVLSAIQGAVVDQLSLLAGHSASPAPAAVNGTHPEPATTPAAEDAAPGTDAAARPGRPTPRQFAAAWRAVPGESQEARMRALAARYGRAVSTIRNWRNEAREHGANVD